MKDQDLSIIGADVKPSAQPTDLAQREEESFALAKTRQERDHEFRVHQSELGTVGRFFGSRDNAITYLIVLLVLASCVMLGVFSFVEAKGATQASEFFKAIGLAGMGYLTGKSKEAKKD